LKYLFNIYKKGKEKRDLKKTISVGGTSPSKPFIKAAIEENKKVVSIIKKNAIIFSLKND